MSDIGPGAARFGVVVLRSGAEVLTSAGTRPPEVEEIGTLAEILELQPKDDGTSDLLSVGSRRFAVCRKLFLALFVCETLLGMVAG